MALSFIRLVKISFLLSCLLPPVLAGCHSGLFESGLDAILILRFVRDVVIALAIGASFDWFLRKSGPAIDSLCRKQVEFIDFLPDTYLVPAIVAGAALSLFLELAVIRWQGTVWEFFAFYKNLSLLACFAGLGLGYALAGRDRIPLVFAAPLLSLQMGLLIFLRYGLPAEGTRSLSLTPFREQLNMGVGTASTLSQYVAVYFFLAVVFLLTALAFVPIGQVCGRLLERTEKLRSYGLNLLGSLLGVVLMLGVSLLWTPPAIWFVLAFSVLLLFQVFQRRALLIAVFSSLAGLVILVWPVSFGWERIYSPYQLLERGSDERGLAMIRAAGHYYQRVLDLSFASQLASPSLRKIGNYYELPYRLRAGVGKVAVVGAGTGNDVAAALRAGAERVDAIEIDPAIQTLGSKFHPERPFSNSRVSCITNDARSFLRTTDRFYDLIVYGLLDSHTLLSHASSVRLDSFVYTVEGLQEARARLTKDGIVSLSFSILSKEIGRKIYLMMEKAFDGHPPVCVQAKYDNSVIFFQSKDGALNISPDIIARAGFVDISRAYGDSRVQADVSTDDWPFFYMPKRVYPASYLIMVALVLFLSVAFFTNFLPERPCLSEASFFFLGAGFMLVETKGITEMGLAFGNTWQVIGIVVAGILIMAYLANTVVRWLAILKPTIPYLLLLASLLLGLVIARSGGLPSTPVGKLATAIVLTCPVFFSGIVFSTLLANTGRISGVMAVNLLGAMCGGLLEYNSMYFGFQSLYWLAIGLYLAAFLSSTVLKFGHSPALARELS
ncbi:MAG: hypothetical protein LAP85_18840 [Acidobacteriia bacterium]|nr:hypothetical protein [Terriglobia bacterium]